MNKALLIIVCTIGIVSCGQGPPIDGSNKTGEIGDYTIVVIDGCEYLEYRRGGGESAVYSLTHKGNCNNHIK